MELRTPARQVEGLAIVWDLLPTKVEAKLVLGADERGVAALRVADKELVFAEDGYDLWREGSLIEQDLDAKQAVDRLVAS